MFCGGVRPTHGLFSYRHDDLQGEGNFPIQPLEECTTCVYRPGGVKMRNSLILRGGLV